jgi:hypothetical protein
VIDLRESPEVIIDVIRTFRWQLDEPNGGLPPGGTPPPPPPGPDDHVIEPTMTDVMRELLKLSKQVATLQKRLGS